MVLLWRVYLAGSVLAEAALLHLALIYPHRRPMGIVPICLAVQVNRRTTP